LYVPGNHDIERNRVSKKHIETFYQFNNQDEITEILTDPDLITILTRKFSNFNDFIENVTDRQLFDESRYWYSKGFEIREEDGNVYNIRLIGLNSCLFAGYDGDENQKLALGLYQVNQAIDHVNDVNLSIGFFHHPFSCYHPADKVCHNSLMKKLDIILCSHQHKPSNMLVRNTPYDAVVISTGTNDTEGFNCFNIVEIETNTGQGFVDIYKYISEKNRWDKDRNSNPYNTGERLSFDLKSKVLREAYLKHLWDQTCMTGGLEGIDPKAAYENYSRLNLGAVYTQLMTHSALKRENELEMSDRTKLSVLEFINKNPHVLILGDPGCGKTTFIDFLTCCMAGELLGSKKENLDLLTKPVPTNNESKKKPQPWDHGPLLPIKIILRELSTELAIENRPSASIIWDFIENELENFGLENYLPYLKHELQEKGGILLLDGLDEVPETDNRRLQIKNIVQDFTKTFIRCRVVITCRTYAYQKQDWRLPTFYETVLTPFSDEQIKHFIDNWYIQFAELKSINIDEGQGSAAILKRAIFTNSRLRELAVRPLLLTMIVSLHAWRGGSLPETREELYSDTIDLLLDRWEHTKIIKEPDGQISNIQPSLTEWLKTDRSKVRNFLNELAYHAHAEQKGPTGTADIPEKKIVAGLIALSQSPDIRPRRLMDYLSDRTALILQRGVDIYTFSHRVFQEYLAACHLTDNEYPIKIAELARNDPERWREICLLSGAKAGRGSEFSIWALADVLCYKDADDFKIEQTDVWGAFIAGQLLAESLNFNKVSAHNLMKLNRIKSWLLKIISGSQLPLAERVLAGNYLSKLGDPRFNSESWYLPNDGNLGLVMIPAGKFLMGSDKGRDSELPQHVVELSEFWISIYPVTMAQFRAFVEDSKYDINKIWEKNNENENHPVVRVSLNDAQAYCSWLSDKIRERGVIARLPSEAEWEKAARGSDGRLFPWGDEISIDRANFYEAGIGSTSTVGCFPTSASAYGILDMSGNVREWTCSLWGNDPGHPDFKYPYNPNDGREDISSESLRVTRGGSFNDGVDKCRNSARLPAKPSSRDSNLGFRVVTRKYKRELLINNLVWQFIKIIEPSQIEIVFVNETLKQLNELQINFNGEQDIVSEIILYGSFARKTAISPIMDIDVLFLFKLIRHFSSPQRAFINLKRIISDIYIKQVVDNSHRAARFRSYGASIIVEFKNRIRLEVTPAIISNNTSSEIMIPDSRLNRWVLSNHEKHDMYSSQLDSKSNGIYNALIKLFKHWQYHPHKKRFFSSFMLECLVADNFDITDGNLLKYFENTLIRIKSKYNSPDKLRFVPVMGVPSDRKRTNLSPNRYSELMKLIDVTIERIASAKKAKTLEQEIEEWRKIFGSKFPTNF
ncbi:Serine/threonine-protein kinase pkn1, partial [Candidatus Magnetomorum sp. HK-1]